MHYLIKYLDKLFKMQEEKGWKYLYFMVDVHNTIIRPTYNKSLKFEYYPYAREVLHLLSFRQEIKLIMWTSTYPDVIEKYEDKFWIYDMKFDYINENPDIKNDEIRCFDKKFYYDIGIDDKFGFDPETDWKIIYDYLIEKGWW